LRAKSCCALCVAVRCLMLVCAWARRLKRVFGIEIELCVRCGGRLKVIASIEEPELIERILAHRRQRGEEAQATASLGARGPPQASLF
jgi:hypothetical protein